MDLYPGRLPASLLPQGRPNEQQRPALTDRTLACAPATCRRGKGAKLDFWLGGEQRTQLEMKLTQVHRRLAGCPLVNSIEH